MKDEEKKTAPDHAMQVEILENLAERSPPNEHMKDFPAESRLLKSVSTTWDLEL